jgi:pimeloyl-ACP methyl ester carboxylesterase
LALRHPDLVRSLVLVSTWARCDAYFRTLLDSFRWLVDGAPSERAALEAFFLWIYTPRAHNNGMMQAIVDEALSTPSTQPPEAFVRQLEAFTSHFLIDELHKITAPTRARRRVLERDRRLAAPVPSSGRARHRSGSVRREWTSRARSATKPSRSTTPMQLRSLMQSPHTWART